MRLLRGIGKFIWRFMVIFSFIVNIVLLLVLLIAGLFIFEIKGQVADPLIGGLHSTAAGLGEATIDWVIPVRDSLGIELDVPINANTIISPVTEIAGQAVTETIAGETVVTLTRPVPINIAGAYIQTESLTLSNATVSITLPAGTQLPVALDMEVELVTDIPVELDVRAVIPLSQTQLIDPINQLGLLFEPLAIGLHNLPDDWNQAGQFASAILSGDQSLAEMLLDTSGNGFNDNAYDAWGGYSRTAGLNYDLMNEAYPFDLLPVETDITVVGGIPGLDALLPDRQIYYDNNGDPVQHNTQAQEQLQAAGVPAHTYNGEMATAYEMAQGELTRPLSTVNEPQAAQSQSVSSPSSPVDDSAIGGVNAVVTPTPNQSGIIPTPSSP